MSPGFEWEGVCPCTRTCTDTQVGVSHYGDSLYTELGPYLSGVYLAVSNRPRLTVMQRNRVSPSHYKKQAGSGLPAQEHLGSFALISPTYGPSCFLPPGLWRVRAPRILSTGEEKSMSSPLSRKQKFPNLLPLQPSA